MDKKLRIFHNIVEVVVLTVIASAMFTIMVVDFKTLGGTTAAVMTISQIVVGLTCIPGGYTIKKGIDSFFEWVEERILEEAEEG